MSDGDIYVNYGSVNDVEDVLNDATNAISKIVDSMQQEVAPLVASWEGSSQDEYTKVKAKWASDIADMHSLLSEYAPTLDQMKINYGTTDNNLALQWSAIS